jgi:DNA-directed RNA polymerase subunit RPC12/RpoP
MTKTKRIVCPYCKTAHLSGGNYYFTENMSMKCGKCDRFIFSTSADMEPTIPKLAEKRYSMNRGFQTIEEELDFA